MSRKLTRRERARKRQRWAKAMHSAALERMRAPLSGSDNVDWSSVRDRPISDSLSFLGPLTERCRPESFLDAIRSESGGPTRGLEPVTADDLECEPDDG